MTIFYALDPDGIVHEIRQLSPYPVAIDLYRLGYDGPYESREDAEIMLAARSNQWRKQAEEQEAKAYYWRERARVWKRSAKAHRFHYTTVRAEAQALQEQRDRQTKSLNAIWEELIAHHQAYFGKDIDPRIHSIRLMATKLNDAEVRLTVLNGERQLMQAAVAMLNFDDDELVSSVVAICLALRDLLARRGMTYADHGD